MRRSSSHFAICPFCGSRVSRGAKAARGRKGGNANYYNSVLPGGRPMGKRNQRGRTAADIYSIDGGDATPTSKGDRSLGTSEGRNIPARPTANRQPPGQHRPSMKLSPPGSYDDYIIPRKSDD